ncbi:MAG: hypothetical protein NUV67_05825, partial [archaeon]|nr:hypothetical protein [archaeon]
MIQMCLVAGCVSKKGKSVAPQIRAMLLASSHRGPEAFGVKTPHAEAKSKTLDSLAIPDSPIMLAHSLLSVTGNCIQPITVGNASVSHNGQIYNYNEFEGAGSFESDSAAIASFFANAEPKDFPALLKKFAKKANGEYSAGLLFGESLFAFRDFLGLKPLWVGENSEVVAFASEPRALIRAGMEFPVPIKPGEFVELSARGFSSETFFSLEDFRASIK